MDLLIKVTATSTEYYTVPNALQILTTMLTVVLYTNYYRCHLTKKDMGPRYIK